MAKRRLKVFQAQLGFYDTVVAAPSQAAALRAWGVHQNLFAGGHARVTEDEKAVKAALAHAETPLKRAVGSRDAYAIEATGVPKVPKAPKTGRPPRPAKPQPPPKPPADRSRLDAAEAALKAFDEARKRDEARLRRQQDDLDAEQAAAQEAYVEGRKAHSATVVEARRAYRKAGGKD